MVFSRPREPKKVVESDEEVNIVEGDGRLSPLGRTKEQADKVIKNA
jgi:hypothetical protein